MKKLVIEELKKNFGKKEVLKDINFTFEEGKIYGLLGRNGAGKTTLFNCLNEDLDIVVNFIYWIIKKKKRLSHKILVMFYRHQLCQNF